MQRIIFHLGAHRVGSTAIQGLLKENRQVLRHQDKRLFLRPQINENPDLSPLLTLYRPTLFGPASARNVKRFVRALEDKGDLIISDENLVGRMPGPNHAHFYPGLTRFFLAMSTLENRLGARFEFRFMARRQDRLLESLFAFQVTRGLTMDFETFIAGLRLPQFNWGQWLLAAERYGFGDRIKAGLLENFSVENVATLFDSSLKGALAGNASLTPRQLMLWRALTAFAAMPEKGPARHALVLALHDLQREPRAEDLRDLLLASDVDISVGDINAALASLETLPEPQFDEATRQRLLASWADDNGRFLSDSRVIGTADHWN